MEVPPELLQRAAGWKGLKRWERRELGQELRRLGLAYREIQKIIPVPKGTLSGWCRDIELTSAQLERLRSIGGNSEAGRAKAGATLRKRNLARIEAIRSAAREEATRLTNEPDWVAGVVAYWAEGAKRDKQVKFSNSDPGLILLFLRWAMKFFQLSMGCFTARVHYHAGQNETQLRAFWSNVTGIPLNNFRKGFMKEEGTGHRKNVLYNGTLQVTVRRSSALLHRVLEWIDCLASTSSGSDTLSDAGR